MISSGFSEVFSPCNYTGHAVVYLVWVVRSLLPFLLFF